MKIDCRGATPSSSLFSFYQSRIYFSPSRPIMFIVVLFLKDHKGINCFSPVVNILRHPLWGRNQETLGEDPFLTGELSNAFVRGLSALPPRGSLSRRLLDEEHVYLTTACCKHFAVHSGPENVPVSRLSFEANVSAADLFLTYLPAFKACLANGAAQSVMCSYNGINGVPNCANKWLLTDVLRGYLGFKGRLVFFHAMRLKVEPGNTADVLSVSLVLEAHCWSDRFTRHEFEFFRFIPWGGGGVRRFTGRRSSPEERFSLLLSVFLSLLFSVVVNCDGYSVPQRARCLAGWSGVVWWHLDHLYSTCPFRLHCRLCDKR